MPSTLNEVEVALLAACENSYARTQSVEAAWAFYELCSQWLILKPVSGSHEAASGSFNVAAVEKMRSEAMTFIRAKSGSAVRFLGVRNDFR